jgi:hypothetical protein
VFKLPVACGYHAQAEAAARNWDPLWAERPLYYACALPVVQEQDGAFWRMLKGKWDYEEHPEVEKEWDA